MSNTDAMTQRACSVVGFAVTLVCACYADVPTVVFELRADSDQGCASFQVRRDWGDADSKAQTWTWKSPQSEEIWGGEDLVACIHECEITVVGDPQLNHNFSVQSGSVATTFRIASGLLTFSPITQSAGWLSVTFMLADANGDGATLEGTYLAQYNGWAGDPASPQGVTLGECVFSMEAGPYESVAVTCHVPPTLFPGGVHDMSVLVEFTLSAHDIASVVGSFVIVPCYGDLDGGGSVDLSDLERLLMNYGATNGVGYADGDMNTDGRIDLEDLATLLSVYGESCE